jgi:hypothetical protein
MLKLSKGVPQGSILEPLLFILYINDLTFVSSKLHFTLFADDTTVLFSDSSLKSTLDIASIELKVVFEWFAANKLCLNINKTKFMLFATGLHCTDMMLSVFGSNIVRVHSTKFLGLIIDDQLCWQEYIRSLHVKLSKSFGMLKAASLCMPRDILLLMFHAFFNSHLLYCHLIWGNAYTSYLNPIKVLYKRCIRLFTHSHPSAHTPPLAHQLGLLIFDDIFVFSVAVFMFKLSNNMLPSCINYMFEHLQGSTRRNAYDYFLPQVRLNVCKKFITFSGVQVWLKLPCILKSLSNLRDFKNSYFMMLSVKYIS